MPSIPQTPPSRSETASRQKERIADQAHTRFLQILGCQHKGEYAKLLELKTKDPQNFPNAIQQRLRNYIRELKMNPPTGEEERVPIVIALDHIAKEFKDVPGVEQVVDDALVLVRTIH